jgi:cobyrinic acid a,c-diamide synthase
MKLTAPRLAVGGLSGDAGKTLVALGLARAFSRRGLGVAPFKKGPDYIDSAWLGEAARRPGRNLDTFLMGDAQLGRALATAEGSDLVVVEGNRGLFDGADARGTHSTAELAKRLAAPVLLVVDVRKATRTVAALVLGCQAFDRDLRIAGVVLNRVATARQERLVREAVERATGIPVVGAIPLLRSTLFPDRHLGLVTAAEHPCRDEAIEGAANAVEAHVSLETVAAIAAAAPAVSFSDAPPPARGPSARVAVVRDEAFSFYYPENLEALAARGAELLPVSALAGEPLPDADAVYVGGGFPEVHAARLAAAEGFLASLRRARDRGVPIYAECGGLMLLARTLTVDGRSHRMSGVLDLDVEQTRRPQGHGYAEGRIDRENPFFAEGEEIRGHEFHYSRVTGGDDARRTAVALGRGGGVAAGRDGVCHGSVFASYVHVHAATSDAWADGLMAAARGRERGRAQLN